MKSLLSVDWDYFFAEPWGMESQDRTGSRQHLGLYDWGHKEAPFFADFVWTVRAAGFQGMGLELPTTDGLEAGFWGRVRIAEDSQLYLADSHAMASSEEVLEGIDEVWNYDAHHDCGYSPERDMADLRQGIVQCGNWAMYAFLAHGIRVEQRYPTWKTRALEVDHPPGWVNARHASWNEITPEFDRVFVCRSSCWVPPWCDEAFARFVDACPAGRGIPAKVYEGPTDPTVGRQLDAAQVGSFVAQARQARAEAKEAGYDIVG